MACRLELDQGKLQVYDNPLPNYPEKTLLEPPKQSNRFTPSEFDRDASSDLTAEFMWISALDLEDPIIRVIDELERLCWVAKPVTPNHSPQAGILMEKTKP